MTGLGILAVAVFGFGLVSVSRRLQGSFLTAPMISGRELRLRLKEGFDRAEIGMPNGQLDVWLRGQPQAA